MKTTALFVLGLLFAMGPAFAAKVYIDYDANYDGSSIKTFAWIDTPETSVAGRSPLLHSRIVNGVEYYLTLRGLSEDENAPDVYVTYHTSSEKKVSLDTVSYGYGYPVGWGYHGRPYPYEYATAVTGVHVYEKGTLIVDVWDAESDKLVWRGIAMNITVTDNPSKMAGKIDKALKKMVAAWQKTRERKAR